MSKRNPERLKRLQTQNRLAKRRVQLVRQWSKNGVSVSPVSHERYWLLVDKLRGGRSWPLEWTDNLAGVVSAFAIETDVVTIMGWDVSEEPAVLVPKERLLARLHCATDIYPDGFVVINDATMTALLVDIDDQDGVHTNVVDLPKGFA